MKRQGVRSFIMGLDVTGVRVSSFIMGNEAKGAVAISFVMGNDLRSNGQKFCNGQ